MRVFEILIYRDKIAIDYYCPPSWPFVYTSGLCPPTYGQSQIHRVRTASAGRHLEAALMVLLQQHTRAIPGKTGNSLSAFDDGTMLRKVSYEGFHLFSSAMGI